MSQGRERNPCFNWVATCENQSTRDRDSVLIRFRLCGVLPRARLSLVSVECAPSVRGAPRSQVAGARTDRHEKLTMRAAHLAQPGTRDTTIRLRFVCTSYHRLRTCFFKKKVASIPQGHMARHALMAHCSKVSTTLTLHMITRTSREVRTHATLNMQRNQSNRPSYYCPLWSPVHP